MATYVIGDIHNSLKKLDKMLKLISPSMQDQIILLGDLFDRGGADPDPVGVFFRLSGFNTNVKWIRGNHDQLLAEYIYSYYDIVEKKRSNLHPYRYMSLCCEQEVMNMRILMSWLQLIRLLQNIFLQYGRLNSEGIIPCAYISL